MHMISFCELCWVEDRGNPDKQGLAVQTSPSKHLDVEISPENRQTVKTTALMLGGGNEATLRARRNILRDAFGGSAKVKLAQRKLDAVCRVKAHCGMLNDNKALEKLEDMMKMEIDR